MKFILFFIGITFLAQINYIEANPMQFNDYNKKLVKLNYTKLNKIKLDILIGNYATISVKRQDGSLYIYNGLVTKAKRLSDDSIFITYVDKNGLRHLYEHYPEMQKSFEKIMNISFINEFSFDEKKTNLKSRGFKHISIESYLLNQELHPEKQLVVFIQKLGVMKISLVEGYLMERPSKTDMATSQIYDSSIDLRLLLEDGTIRVISSHDIVQIFVK